LKRQKGIVKCNWEFKKMVQIVGNYFYRFRRFFSLDFVFLLYRFRFISLDFVFSL
jgi:hypothetical protein